MIRNSPVGISPTLTININGVPVNYNSLSSVRMNFEENTHDLCEVRMSGVPTSAITDYIGQSISAQISLQSTLISQFYGTIEVCQPDATTSQGLVNGSLFQDVTFSALGCSRSMRGSSGESWHQQTLASIAAKYCDTYGFSLDVPNDPLIFTTLIQSIESDWQFINRVCTMMGYSITVNGTHMHIFDPFKAKGRQISLHNLFTPAKSSAAPYPGQIIKFDGNFAQRAYDGRYFDSLVTVQPDTGDSYDLRTSDINALSTPATYTNNVNFTAGNYVEAARMLQSQYKSDYDYRAEVITLGMPGVLPGGLVNLTSYGGSFDGLWYVHGVQQDVRSGAFFTTADIRRNKVDTLVDTSAPLFRTPPAPQSINGKWTTTSRVVNVY